VLTKEMALVYYGNADGAFGKPVRLPGSATHSKMGVGDLNGDGRAELLVPDGGDQTSLRACFWTENRNIVSQSIPHGSSSVQGAHVADMNADGRPDIVVAPRGGGVLVLLNQRPGPRADTVRQAPPPERSAPVAPIPSRDRVPGIRFIRWCWPIPKSGWDLDICDMDDDGLLDLAATLTMDTERGLTYWPGASPGPFGEMKTFKFGRGMVRQLVAADVDGDGRKEYLVAIPSSGLHLVDVHTDQVRVLDDRPCQGVACYDWTGDGIPDILYAHRPQKNSQTAVLSMLVGRRRGEGPGIERPRLRPGTGRLRGRRGEATPRGRTWPVDARGQIVLLADADGQGPDVAAVHDDRVYVMRWNGENFLRPTGIVRPGMDSAQGRLESADFNGDGHADLVVRGQREGKTWVFYLREDRSVLAEVALQSASGRSVGAGDVNDDGIDDLLLMQDDGLYLYAGTKADKFADPALVWDGYGSPNNDIEVLDMNGDGRLDIAAYGLAVQFVSGGGALSVLLNLSE
jgi:hypothetical protein